MRGMAEIETQIDALEGATTDPWRAAKNLLALGEEILMHWIAAKGETAGVEYREGFRLLGLHRQGAKGVPSFNACRESCRELVYHYNLTMDESDRMKAEAHARLAARVAKHLFLFVSGKMEVEQLGEFCCASKPLRTVDEDQEGARAAS